MKKTTYQAICSTCYTYVVGEGSKKDADRAATSHINAYQHNVSIIIKAVR